MYAVAVVGALAAAPPLLASALWHTWWMLVNRCVNLTVIRVALPWIHVLVMTACSLASTGRVRRPPSSGFPHRHRLGPRQLQVLPYVHQCFDNEGMPPYFHKRSKEASILGDVLKNHPSLDLGKVQIVSYFRRPVWQHLCGKNPVCQHPCQYDIGTALLRCTPPMLA